VLNDVFVFGLSVLFGLPIGLHPVFTFSSHRPTRAFRSASVMHWSVFSEVDKIMQSKLSCR